MDNQYKFIESGNLKLQKECKNLSILYEDKITTKTKDDPDRILPQEKL